jgi:hypothetical protein
MLTREITPEFTSSGITSSQPTAQGCGMDRCLSTMGASKVTTHLETGLKLQFFRRRLKNPKSKFKDGISAVSGGLFIKRLSGHC